MGPGSFGQSGTHPGPGTAEFGRKADWKIMASPARTPVGTTGGGRQAVPSLSAWRERAVRMLARSAAILVVVAYPPSIWLSIVNGFPSLVVVDTMACAGVLLAALRPSLPYRVRAGLLLGVFYVLAVVLLVQVGMPGAGLVWLAMVPVVAALLLGMRGATVAIGSWAPRWCYSALAIASACSGGRPAPVTSRTART